MDDLTKKKIFKKIGEKIKTARRNKKSQQELANILGLTRTSITNIESGSQHVQIFTLWQIADTLGVSIQDLLPSKAEIGTVYELIPDDIDKTWIEGVKNAVNKESENYE